MPVPRIVIVGSGFAGYGVARRLERRLRPAAAEILMVSPFGYSLYQPLLPEVAAGLLDPRSIAGPLHRLLRRTRLVPGKATAVDPGSGPSSSPRSTAGPRRSSTTGSCCARAASRAASTSPA
ncbi:hypothetical protein ACFQHO_42530 [Actinomadura yumaensis]|uniref:hypothetical protein n=1 Tax=Actinomadura yumaensis TaxID=111807 RepID=UPI00361DCDE9